MSAELPKMRQAFSDWWRSLPQDQRYDFDSEGRGYKKPPEVLMWAAWQEAARQAMERECEWTRDSDFESEVWNTACGNAFIFTDGGPAENGAKFCCYCGGKLRALIPQDPDHLAGVGNMVDGKDQSEKRHG